MSRQAVLLVQGRVRLALHPLADGDGDPLLLLHALGGSSADWRDAVRGWPGPVHALDFCGHGASAWVRGGAYHPELLLADADAALAHLGSAHLAGAGIGAYVALLLAGARPDAVRAALLLPGEGLEGCGPEPDFDSGDRDLLRPEPAPDPGRPGADPLVGALARDPRPSDYAESFAARARRLLFAEDDRPRPPWWLAARRRPAAESAPVALAAALRRLAD